MPNPLRDFFMGAITPREKTPLVEAMQPWRTFDDVILPASTRRALEYALAQIQKHDLIFNTWGLAERHSTGLGLVFNFAGPPGTGKTICAEAIANTLGKKLLVVRYSEMESLWAGETGKNVVAVFHAARDQDAVLFFDEADAIAGRRFAAVTQGYQREANTVVNVLLKELEEFDGVVIFATNLAANFDPAFERRIHSHILFELPGLPERQRIWQVQLHPTRTPLAEDVDFAALAAEFEVSGGDIKNAVLKAAQLATAEAGPDRDKKIHHRHFEIGMQEVLASKKVMGQTLFADGDGSHPLSALTGLSESWETVTQQQDELTDQFKRLARRLDEVEADTSSLPAIVERFDEAARTAQDRLRDSFENRLGELSAAHETRLVEIKDEHVALETHLRALGEGQSTFQQRFDEQLGTLGVQLKEGLETERVEVSHRLETERRAREAWQADWKRRWQTQVYVLAGLFALYALVLIWLLLR